MGCRDLSKTEIYSLGYMNTERGILKHSVFKLVRLSLLFPFMTVEFHASSKVNSSSFSSAPSIMSI